MLPAGSRTRPRGAERLVGNARPGGRVRVGVDAGTLLIRKFFQWDRVAPRRFEIIGFHPDQSFSRSRLFLSAISYRRAMMLVKRRPMQGGRMAENLPAADLPVACAILASRLIHHE